MNYTKRKLISLGTGLVALLHIHTGCGYGTQGSEFADAEYMEENALSKKPQEVKVEILLKDQRPKGIEEAPNGMGAPMGAKPCNDPAKCGMMGMQGSQPGHPGMPSGQGGFPGGQSRMPGRQGGFGQGGQQGMPGGQGGYGQSGQPGMPGGPGGYPQGGYGQGGYGGGPGGGGYGGPGGGYGPAGIAPDGGGFGAGYGAGVIPPGGYGPGFPVAFDPFYVTDFLEIGDDEGYDERCGRGGDRNCSDGDNDDGEDGGKRRSR